MKTNPIPVHWVLSPVGDICKVVTGTTPSKMARVAQGGNLPFVKPGDLDLPDPIFTSEEMVKSEEAEQGRLLPPGTVLVSCIGNLGKVGLLGTAGLTNQQINAVVPASVTDHRFLYYWAMTLKPWLEAHSSATTISIINKSRFEGAPLPLPPLPEQRRIVAKLDELFARNRAAKASLERLPTRLDQLRQAMLAAALQGDLTETFRENGSRRHADVRSTPESNAYRPPRAPKSPHSAPPLESQLPPGWSKLPLAQVADIQVGYAFKSNEFARHGIRLLRGINVLPGATRWDEVAHLPEASATAYARYSLNVGDIVLAMDRPIITSGLKVTRITEADCPSLLVQRVARITGRTGVSTDFLFSFLQSAKFIDHLRDQATGTQLPHISASDIGAALVLVPPLDEQQEIVRHLGQMDSVLSRLRHSVDTAQAQANLFVRAALAAAFRGELAPQDPNDEPAAVLLERVRAEREASQPVKRKRGATASAPARARSSKETP